MWRPLSILIFELSPKAFGVILGGVFLFFLIGVISLNLWVDPYFVFRRSSFEPRLSSVDSQQSFAKPLQIITRQPQIVILGSSRVYRGFDVEGDVYNMGISSLTLAEASAYIDHILRFTSVRKIILGLDFWMCDEVTPTRGGWDKETGAFSYTLKSFLKALFETKETTKSLKESFILRNPALKEEGWTYEGFFHTPKYSKSEVDAKLLSYEKNFQKVHINLEMLSVLENIIYRCQSKGVKLYVYISPLHPRTKEIYKNSSNSLYFEPWRENILNICKRNGIAFKDFTYLLKDSSPLSKGSDQFWIDYSHFSPEIGRYIFQTFKL